MTASVIESLDSRDFADQTRGKDSRNEKRWRTMGCLLCRLSMAEQISIAATQATTPSLEAVLARTHNSFPSLPEARVIEERRQRIATPAITSNVAAPNLSVENSQRHYSVVFPDEADEADEMARLPW
ncbi:hypothetical protein R1flu_005226 [Riccia fluitans]|uniref:Uncharacterized protein n=1 Tax=Riccia fluitans TaxID=41844 RepID=A0ABD1YVJ8_9MARC